MERTALLSFTTLLSVSILLVYNLYFLFLGYVLFGTYYLVSNCNTQSNVTLSFIQRVLIICSIGLCFYIALNNI